MAQLRRSTAFDARNAFASVRPPEQRRIFEGVLTGPVPKLSKTFFLLSADYQIDDVQSTVYAQLPTGLLQENVSSPIRAIDGAARIREDISDRDAFNLPNHVNFAQYVGNESSPFFGHAVAALPARRLQFTLRFKF